MGKAFGKFNKDLPIRRPQKKKEPAEKIETKKEKVPPETELEERKIAPEPSNLDKEIFSKKEKINLEPKNLDSFNYEPSMYTKYSYKEPNKLKISDASLNSIVQLAENFFGDYTKKGKKVKSKLEVIADNFSRADKNSLWETFLNTEREIGPLGLGYIFNDFLPYESLGKEEKEESKINVSSKSKNNNIGILMLILLLIFKEDFLRRAKNDKGQSE